MPKTNIDLNENKNFCILPFIHTHITNWNDIKLCCYSDSVKKYTKDFDFDQDPHMKSIRQTMLENKPVKQCENCYVIERDGGTSFRQRDTIEWVTRLNINDLTDVKPNLIYYDIRNDNTCNLSCRMCNPHASSQIEKEFIKLGWSEKVANTVNNSLNNIINIDTAKKLYIAGGEPSLMPEFRNLLKHAISKNKTDIELRIITNATNINKEFAELLNKFPKKEFVVSLDGYDQINKYIRWPSDWNSIISNIKKLYSMTSSISFSVTVSMWNISNLSQLIRFLNDEFNRPIIFLNEAVRGGDDYSWPFNFPNKKLALDDLNLMRTYPNYNVDIFKNKLDYFITKLEKTETNLDELANFFAYNDALDQSRNIKLVDYIPELEACRSSITKQT